MIKQAYTILMLSMKQKQHGFHVIELVIILIVIGIVSVVGYTVFSKNNTETNSPNNSSQKSESTRPVKWGFNQQTNEWFAQEGSPPACKEPFVFDNSPADLNKVMHVMAPGSYRGYSYKPHGGFRLDESSNGKADVTLPMDATLVSLTRYYEGKPPELQYLLTFESDCGIAFRFDHLYTLTPEFQKIAEQTPEPKLDDSRTDPNRAFPRTHFKAGTVVATEVGFPKVRNFGFDFGVYDYRKQNDISTNNAAWKAIHNKYTSLEWYALCWYDMLPSSDATKAAALSQIVINPAKPNIISDYCSNAPFKTLDFNNGQPTDG